MWFSGSLTLTWSMSANSFSHVSFAQALADFRQDECNAFRDAESLSSAAAMRSDRLFVSASAAES